MAYNQDLAARVRSNLAGLVEKKMFGGIGYLINGNMACGVHGESLIVRIDPATMQQALGLPFTRPFDLTGKPMKGWILVDPPGYASDEQLRSWIEAGLDYAASLPAK